MSNVINSVDGFGLLEVRSERRGHRCVVALAGELDLSEAPRVNQALRTAEATDARQIELDLTG
jgi:anti-anti-sigma regulatory factor